MARLLLLLIISTVLSIGGGTIRSKTGIYITHIDTFDVKNGTFDITYWMWHIYDNNDTFNPTQSTEIVNAKEIKSIFVLKDRLDANRTIRQEKMQVKVYYNWNYKNYPFDRQSLTVRFEDSDLVASKLQFVPDRRESLLSDELTVDGWKITGFNVSEINHTMETDFGYSLDRNRSVYSQFVVTVDIQRGWYREFINKLLPIYIVFFILCLSFVFKDEYGTKNALFLTAIFILISNKSIIDASLPATSVITFIDKVQILTFIVTALFMTLLAVGITLDSKGKKALEYKIDRISMAVIIPLYFLINLYLFFTL